MFNKIVPVVVISVFVAQAARSQEDVESDLPDSSEDIRPEYLLEDGKVFVQSGDDREELELAVSAMAIHVRGSNLYVALGFSGVAVYDLADPGRPRLAGQSPASGGKVVGFFEVDGGLWMKVDSTTALPLESVAAAAVVSTAFGAGAGEKGEQPEESTMTKAVHIVKTYPGRVKLDAGSDSGIKVEDQFAVFRIMKMDSQDDEDEEFSGSKMVAVLEVIAVSEKTSIARVWRGDRVSLSDEVTPVRERRMVARAVFPRRFENLGEVSVVIRPLLNVVGSSGFGFLGDLAVSWWGSAYFIDIRMQPLGFGWTDDGNIVSSSFLAEAGYDSRAFAVGLGAGVGVVSGDMGEMLVSKGLAEVGLDNSGNRVPEQPKWENRTTAAFALSQVVRLGARDGLHLNVYNLFLYYSDEQATSDDEDETGFVYGGTTGRFNIPLGARTDLFLGGGGGRMGYAFGEVGVFTWIKGNGDSGSFGVSTSAGGAGVWGVRKREYADYWDTEHIVVAGPMVSLGLTYRFGPTG